MEILEIIVCLIPFLFIGFCFFAVYMTEVYDRNESFLYNMGILVLGLF